MIAQMLGQLFGGMLGPVAFGAGLLIGVTAGLYYGKLTWGEV